MTPYKYQPLRIDADEIRLLSLLPGNSSEEIIISIETVPLGQNDFPQYEALSYTWGSSDDRAPLSIGALRNETLDITQNLATALPYLRLRDRPRVLWIDAICIDQKSLTERSHQVKRMGDIFQKAERVIVWLGPEGMWSTLALRTLEHLASKIEVDWQISVMKPASTGCPEAHWADRGVALPYDFKTWSALYHLLSRSWFERLWIWQEIRLQSREAVMLCGTDAIPWQHFRSAIYCLRAKLKEPNIRGLNDRIDHVARLCDVPVFAGLEALITQTMYCKCSDPRDRIFAVLGLLDKSEADIDIQPDYTKTVGRVYKDVAVEYIKKRRNLEILRYCGMRDKASGTTKWIPDWAVPTQLQDWEMPSWVPDWSIPRAGNDLPYVYATGGAFGESRYDGAEALEVTGVALGTVSAVQKIFPLDATYTTSETLEIMQRLAPPYFENHLYIAGGSLGDAFLRTFCCNVFDDTYLPPYSTLPNFQIVKEAFLGLLASQESFASTPPVLSTYLKWVHEYVIERSLFRMKEGYIGLAPEVAQVGDQVYVILGCDAPLILRPTMNNEWQVVGRCYIDGVEDGRVFLGDLPKPYRRVIRFEEVSGKWWPAYLNQQTGDILVEDPRLGPLPPGWRVKRHKHQNAWDWYTDDDFEEDRNQQQKLPGDPRWTVDALRRRGVILQNFKLV